LVKQGWIYSLKNASSPCPGKKGKKSLRKCYTLNFNGIDTVRNEKIHEA
jgi:hypothetical protein